MIFQKKNSYFQSQVDKIRKEAYAGVVAGPFGLIISYSIAAGVVEGKLIPELKNKLKSVQNFFTTLSNTVKQANKDIDAAKLKLTTEIAGNDSNLLIVFYVQIMPDDFVMQLHRF